MEALDLTKFLWLNKETKHVYIILAITTYGDEDVVVYREFCDRAKLQVDSVSNFAAEHDATYQVR